ncbi:pyridoxal-dependent decarboxylase, exosortase A system-associated [Paraglaciecola sp.]|uniref:pyridoxal-dependent decarboxylase, exosortase A system-associated n=1 Tax=Paraglaciecola sp. TaxID=1920173 RepID=UPI0030F3A239
MKHHLQHHPLTIQNNQLIIAGKTADEIVAIVGQTPCYVYDSECIAEQVSILKQRLPKGIKLHYAIKANPYAPLVGRMASWVEGFDVASHQELLLALSSGMPAKNISFAGPGKSNADLNAAVASGVVINIESKNELMRIYTVAEQQNKQANIALRINPDFALKHSGMSMAGGAKPFGIDAELATELMANLNTERVNFKGLHIFSGSQNLNHDALMHAHDQTFALAYRLLKDAAVCASQINIGGGFGIPYFVNDTPLQITPLMDNLGRLMDEYWTLLNDAEIHLELGRYLVGSSGVYLSKVIDKKQSRGKTYLITDGGMHHHLANSGNFGQVIRKNYPVLLANCFENETEEVVDVVGLLCTPLDIMASQVSLPTAQIGDLFAVLQSGAYGPTASPQGFLSQPQVKEIML